MEPRDLYGLPLERFTAERNALARELRRDGHRDQAAEVAKLRKPSVAAWAVNQLVRTQARELKSLYKAGDALERAQAKVLAGRAAPASLRAAVDAERAAVGELLSRARGLLSAEGHELSPAGLEQVSETLHAAALDPEARALVGDGCLTRELRHIGLGGTPVESGPGARAAPRRAKAPPAAPKPRKATPKLKPKPTPAARRAEADARRRLERADGQLAAAEERRTRAESQLQQAEQAVTEARHARAEAAEEHERARAALEAPDGP
jgi:hypothetical protein